jgi:transcription initiation factor TFIID TATA-box-binding protein
MAKKAKSVKKTKAVPKKTAKPAKELKEKEKNKEIRIVNIVVSGSLDKSKIPLEKMAATLPNTEYNPEQFPGLVLRIREPKTSALIFNSGKIVCTGARSMEQVDEAMNKIVETMKKINIDIKKKPEYQVQNMVASGSIGMTLNLNTLAIKLENTEYEPEQFPGLVYKLRGTKATFLLFTNGQIVCTGTKSEDEVHDAVKKLVDVLKNLAKK